MNTETILSKPELTAEERKFLVKQYAKNQFPVVTVGNMAYAVATVAIPTAIILGLRYFSSK